MDDSGLVSLVTFVTTFWFVFLVFFAAAYVFGCYIMFRIGQKFGIGTFGEYLIPIYGWVLICRCAGISAWNLLWYLLPPAGIVFSVYLFGTLAERLHHNFWAYGLSITFLSGLPLIILAFDDSMPARAEEKPKAVVAGSSIYCVAGEFAGNKLDIGSDGMIIGRNSAKANLVLSSLDVSGMHLRVWPDRSGAGIWVQDMASRNGSYYTTTYREGQPPQWIQLHEPTLLKSGTHFRLGDNAAEFVVS